LEVGFGATGSAVSLATDRSGAATGSSADLGWSDCLDAELDGSAGAMLRVIGA
jgi:hypothetical protein